ncbi:MAG: AtpZ/AtpI family protein [Planctomycetota bacterium]|jgi:hypothetical protein
MKGNNEPGTDPEKQELYKALAMIGSLGFTVTAAITLTFLAGLYISREFDLGPAPIIAAIALGTGGSFFWIYKKLTRNLKYPVKHDDSE